MDSVTEFKGLHRGKRVFILASGPSLKDLDLDRLQHRIVIGLNRSVLVYPETHYHCVFDDRLFTDFGDAFRASRFLFTLENRPFGIPMKLLGAEGFSWDLAEGIYSGYTISYFAMQLAAYMGFQQIIYLGLDLRHREGETHFFGQDYRSRTHESTEFPRMAKMLTRGVQALSEKGVEVFNCSPLCTLDCFKKISFDDAIKL